MRRSVHVATAGVLFATLAVGWLPATAAEEPTRITVGAAADHATQALHDAWDYSQSTDLMTDGGGVTRNVHFEYEGKQDVPGTVTWITSGEWYVTPFFMTWPHAGSDPGAMHEAWDGLTNPIDADTLTQVSMRIHATQHTPTRLEWFTCQEYDDACRGAMRINLEPGWNTVAMPIENTDYLGLPQEWDGQVLGLRLASENENPTTFRLDWLRIHAEGDLIEVPSDTGQLSYDSDLVLTNNGGQADPAAGNLPVRTGSSPAFQVVDTGLFPPGTWYLYEDSNYIRTVEVVAPPQPQVLDPDMAGGADYATEVLGNPWDFDDADDYVAVRNASNVSLSGSRLAGTNSGNDPYVVLPLAADGLDPVHYHRVTVDQSYDGAFNLDDSVNGGLGGTHGRLVWRTASHSSSLCPVQAYSDGREFVFFTHRNEYTYDMADVSHDPVFRSTAEPNVGVTQPGACSSVPVEQDPTWAREAPLTYLRFDPNEAPSAYRWYLHDLRIAADDAASPTFDITWVDPTRTPGTTTTVALDDDRTGYDGEVLAEVSEQAGTNRVTFDATDRLPATYWVHVTSESSDGLVGRDYATGPLQVDPRIAGANRILTATRLSEQTFDTAATAVLASSTNFPDALAAVQVADAVDGPLLLTPPTRLDDAVATELGRLGVTRVIIAGGNAAVDGDVTDALRAKGFNVSRIGGADRYETAALLADEAVRRWGGPVDEVIVAVGTAFPDALAAGPLAGHANVPLLLAHPGRVAEPTAAAIADWAPDDVMVAGGVGALSDEIVRETVPTGKVRRLAGDDRYATAARLAEAAVDRGADSGSVLIATGLDFPDALAAGPAAIGRGGVLLLTSRTTVPTPTRSLLAEQDGAWTSWRVVGGRAAVSHATVRSLLESSDL